MPQSTANPSLCEIYHGLIVNWSGEPLASLRQASTRKCLRVIDPTQFSGAQIVIPEAPSPENSLPVRQHPIIEIEI